MRVLDKFGSEIHVGSVVILSSNSGTYMGRVTKFNWYDDNNGVQRIGTVQVMLTSGRKHSYDGPEWRMICVDEVQNTQEYRKLMGA